MAKDDSKTCGTCWHFMFLKGTCKRYCRKRREIIIEWPYGCGLWVDMYAKTFTKGEQ